jgi:hypothetical protein
VPIVLLSAKLIEERVRKEQAEPAKKATAVGALA